MNLRPSLTHALRLAGACCLTLTASAFAASGAWPTNIVKIIVPYPPGTSGDLIARRLSPAMGQALGTTVIVENRGGASGNIGMAATANAASDGYTVIMGSDIQFSVAPSLYPKLSYDVETSFEPVGPAARLELALMAYPGVPANNLRELVKLVKDKPGQISFASTGIGSTHQLFMEQLKMQGGLDMMHVPYTGTGPATPNLVAGEVQVMFFGIPQALALSANARLKPLAVGSLQRLPLMPDVPTIAESGFPGFEASNIWAVWAPAKTPPEVVHKLRDALEKAVNDPDVRKWYASTGLTPIDGGVEAMTTRIRADRKKWAEVIRANKLQATE
ncbi:MFS transporter [Pigmentiphaga litoralis]|nr:MFS transporter [Pigmentiphaga litoralis]